MSGRKLNDLFKKDKVDEKTVNKTADEPKDDVKNADGQKDDKAEPKTDVDPKEPVKAQDQQSKEDGSSEGDKDYEKWSKEDLAKELKKTRQEAAKNRVEKKETEKVLREEFDAKIKALTEEFKPHVEKAQEYEKMKEKEADKKRSLEEKLLHREEKIKELLDQNEDIKTSTQDQIKELQNEINKYKDELGAYESYWTEQLEKELAEIPEAKRELADLMVKGAGNDQAALKAIRKAKSDNLFGDKKVIVNHATPTAKDGARMGADKAQKTGKDMSKNEKVKAGLKAWKDKQRSKLT